MALPAFQPEDEEDVAGAAPGVAPVALAPSLPPPGMPQMPGMPPGAPPAPGAPPPPVDQLPPDPNANLPPDALMQPGPGLQPPAPPLGAPGGPPVPLTPDGKIDIPAAEKGALAEQGQLTAQGEDAERRKGAAEAKVAEAESTGADTEAKIRAQKQQDDQDAIAKANARTQATLDQFQADNAKYRGMGLHDYWADKSTGDKVLAGLAMIFGAAGRTEGNPGMAMVERAIDRDFRMQQANIEKTRSNVELDKQEYDMGLTAKQQALADNQLKYANAYDAAAAQLVSYKLKQGVPLAQAQTDANVVALKQKGLAARQELLQAVHAQNVADAHLQIEQERADAMRLRAEKYKTGGAGGGGGSAALAKLAQAAQNGASQADLMTLGAQLGIPAKHLVQTVTSLQKDPEKLAEMQFTDIHGNVQTANSARAAKAAADQVAAAQAYKEAILALRDHAKQYGRLVNPLSDEAKERDRLQAEVLARGRKALELGVSKSNMELEHKAIGGSGVGLSRMPSIQSLTKIADEVDRVADERVKASARPGQRFGADATRVQPGPAAGGVTPQQRERAKAILANPAMKAKLSNQELAAVVNAAGVL